MLYSMPLITFLVLRALYALGDSIRYHLAKLDGHIDVYEDAFDRFSDETENVPLAMASSFLFKAFSRRSRSKTHLFWINGRGISVKKEALPSKTRLF